MSSKRGHIHVVEEQGDALRGASSGVSGMYVRERTRGRVTVL